VTPSDLWPPNRTTDRGLRPCREGFSLNPSGWFSAATPAPLPRRARSLSLAGQRTILDLLLAGDVPAPAIISNEELSLDLDGHARLVVADSWRSWWGAIAGAAVLYAIASGKAGFDVHAGFASNGFGEHLPGAYSLAADFVREVAMTCS